MLTGGGLGLGLVAGHRCTEVGAWDQGETAMWIGIGIVGLWLGIRVRQYGLALGVVHILRNHGWGGVSPNDYSIT